MYIHTFVQPLNVKDIFKRGIKNYEQIIAAFQIQNFEELKEVTFCNYHPNPIYAFLHKEENNTINLTILCPSNYRLYSQNPSIFEIHNLGWGYMEYTIKNIHLGTRYISSQWEKAITFLQQTNPKLIKDSLFSDVIFSTEQSGNLIFAVAYIELPQQLYNSPLPMSTVNQYQWDKYLLGSHLKECVLLPPVSLP